jgi:hypothetical protein
MLITANDSALPLVALTMGVHVIVSKIIGEHTCEGKSKDKSIGVAD